MSVRSSLSLSSAWTPFERREQRQARASSITTYSLRNGEKRFGRPFSLPSPAGRRSRARRERENLGRRGAFVVTAAAAATPPPDSDRMNKMTSMLCYSSGRILSCMNLVANTRWERGVMGTIAVSATAAGPSTTLVVPRGCATKASPSSRDPITTASYVRKDGGERGNGSKAIKVEGPPPPAATFPPPPLSKSSPVWTDEVWASPIDVRRRIFCNRSLNMRSIKAVGWDMDHTLAQYDAETFESLAYECTIDKMVKHFGYPRLLYDLKFDHTYMTRGLVIDKARGNILKVDRHKYVKVAMHGFKELSRDERVSTYNVVGRLHEFDEPRYALIDTLFSLAEAYLFMQLVEILDGDPDVLPVGKKYDDLYRDVRAGVDLAHRDGTIKRQVAKDPGMYIHEDPGVVSVLDSLRRSGKKIFLATNSLWDYTDVVMNYLIDGKIGSERDHEWLRHFDVVITGCGKPRFFTDRKDLFEVHPETGMLWNTEGGSPMVPIGDADLPSPLLGSTAPSNLFGSKRYSDNGGANGASVPSRARVFQGGSYLDLHKMLGVTAGSEVLYVGDHIYGDVVRSKKDLGWRTMLVIPELESELETLANCRSNMDELKILRRQRDGLEDQVQRLEWRLANSHIDASLHNGKNDDHRRSMNDGDVGREMCEEAIEDLSMDAEEADDECEAGAAYVRESDTLMEQDLRTSASSNIEPISTRSSEASRKYDKVLSSSSYDDEDVETHELLENLREQRNALAARHRQLLKEHHEAFHPVWGQVFKTGYQSSRYAHQVERFACLYTSHVSNLMFHSPFKSYKGRVDTMAHEDEPISGCSVTRDHDETLEEWQH